MANILKELEEKKDKRLNESETFVEGCKGLLEGKSQQERQVLNALGLNVQIKEAERNIEIRIKNEKYTEQFQGKIFHINEIKEIALKYRLFLKSSHEYNGNIPPDLGSIILKLQEEKKIVIGNEDHNFYVLAPPNMFINHNSLINNFKRTHDIMVNKVNTFIKDLLDPDPILFYKIDDDHFLMLKKWGNDLSFKRLIIGSLLKTRGRVVLLAILFVLGAILSPIILFTAIWAKILFGIVFTIYSVLIFANWIDSKIYKEIDTERNWYKPAY